MCQTPTTSRSETTLATAINASDASTQPITHCFVYDQPAGTGPRTSSSASVGNAGWPLTARKYSGLLSNIAFRRGTSAADSSTAR